MRIFCFYWETRRSDKAWVHMSTGLETPGPKRWLSLKRDTCSPSPQSPRVTLNDFCIFLYQPYLSYLPESCSLENFWNLYLKQWLSTMFQVETLFFFKVDKASLTWTIDSIFQVFTAMHKDTRVLMLSKAYWWVFWTFSPIMFFKVLSLSILESAVSSRLGSHLHLWVFFFTSKASIFHSSSPGVLPPECFWDALGQKFWFKRIIKSSRPQGKCLLTIPLLRSPLMSSGGGKETHRKNLPVLLKQNKIKQGWKIVDREDILPQQQNQLLVEFHLPEDTVFS